MNSLVLDLQQQILAPECDVLNALRKAHLIAVKLGLKEFDTWIQSELNGYTTSQDEIPNYRLVSGELKAWNPYHGWIPVVLNDKRLEDALCSRKLYESIGDILELYRKATGYITMTYAAEATGILNSLSTAPFDTHYALHVSAHMLKSIIEKVINCLLEWTVKLESEGIMGEDMQFNEEEKTTAKLIPQTINYYGTVVNGAVSQSQLVSGNQNAAVFNYEAAPAMLEDIRASLANEHLSTDDMEAAVELVDEINEKIQKNKKSSIIKAALNGLKDFLIGVGANTTVAVIQAKMQGFF